MTDFRIYYDGGETYSGDPFNAPAFGVLVIVQRNETHLKRLVSGGDYFVWRDGEWYSCDYIGMVDYLQQPGPKRVLFGRMVDREYFYSIARKAEKDPDFPERIGRHKGELKV